MGLYDWELCGALDVSRLVDFFLVFHVDRDGLHLPSFSTALVCSWIRAGAPMDIIHMIPLF
jgi:hypothetical protein